MTQLQHTIVLMGLGIIGTNMNMNRLHNASSQQAEQIKNELKNLDGWIFSTIEDKSHMED